MTNHYTDVCEETIESLRQQLEASQKREVILRLALETCQVGDFSTGHVVYPSFDEKLVEEALAATADLKEQGKRGRQNLRRHLRGRSNMLPSNAGGNAT